MLTKEQAFEVVTQALEGANIGQRFSLKDSATIFAALGVIANEIGINPQPQMEVVEDEDPIVEQKPSTKKVK